jgi:ABC-2 type transport system permease protein
VTVYYTNVLFGVFAAPNLLFSLFCLWLFGAFLISLLLLTSCIAPGSYGGLLLCAGLLVVLMVAQAIPALQPLNPLELASKNTALLTGIATPGSLTAPILAALVLTAAQLFAAIAIFRKKTI